MCCKKSAKLFLILLSQLLFLLFLPALSCSAGEHYLVTEAELVTLEANFEKLSALSSQSQLTLAKQESELTALQTALREAMTESQALKADLLTLETTSEAQTLLLEKANQSLTTYAKEEKAKQQRLKWQRNIAYILAAGILLFSIS